ncbi:MAG: NAD-dependent epimerase/dehydratase [Acidobacteriaceae bacterium]
MPRAHLERVLITGATGTLGYNIVRELGQAHPETRILVLMRKLDAALFADLPNVALEQVDMLDTARLLEAVLKFRPNAVIHAAASGVRPSNIGYFGLVDLNVSATLQMFRATCEIPGCHFIHISTGLVYGQQDRPCRESDAVNTLHPYGASKAAADLLLRAAAERLDRHLTIVRPFSFTGLHDGGDRLFPSLLRAAAEGKAFEMSPGTQLRDFCAVQDVVEAIALVLEEGDQPGRDIFNVGSGLSVSLGRIVKSVVRQLELDVEVRFGRQPFQALEPTQLVADISRSQSLGWRPRTNLAYAVWQLARSQYPSLKVREPEQYR